MANFPDRPTPDIGRSELAFPSPDIVRSGAAEVDLEGRVFSRFGRFGNQDGQFRLAHDVAVADDASVYVVGAWGQRVQKFTRRKR